MAQKKKPKKKKQAKRQRNAPRHVPPSEREEEAVTNSYPIYLLRLGDELKLVFPENKEDIGHVDFWEQTVSFIVAQHYKVAPKRLANLPYCQQRGRVFGNRFYFGEEAEPDLLAAVRAAVGNEQLIFCYDEHESRLPEDVRRFRRVVGIV